MIDSLQESVEQFMDAVEERVEALEQEARTEIRKATAEIRESLAKEVSKQGQPVPEGHPDDVPVRSWAGVWHEGREYERGTLATRAGATWLATRPTMVQPGVGDSGWKMISKGTK